MVLLFKPLAAIVGALLAAALASADSTVSVIEDATYTIAEADGIVCQGAGEEPTGTACPREGDVTTIQCRPGIRSYVAEDDHCVAPVDAECVIVTGTTWGCKFPQETDTTEDYPEGNHATNKTQCYGSD